MLDIELGTSPIEISSLEENLVILISTSFKDLALYKA